MTGGAFSFNLRRTNDDAKHPDSSGLASNDLLCAFHTLNVREEICNVPHIWSVPYAVTQMKNPGVNVRPINSQLLDCFVRDHARAMNRKIFGKQHTNQE
jgi:hypothetical protein